MQHSTGKPRGPGRQRSMRNGSNVNRNQHSSFDPSELASALKVRNFRKLLELAGSEGNLALALDMLEQRIQELARGERFSAETAYHIETLLDIPGFLDQVNPIISEKLRIRLGNPLAEQVSLGVSDTANEQVASVSDSNEDSSSFKVDAKTSTRSPSIIQKSPKSVPVENTESQEQTKVNQTTQSNTQTPAPERKKRRSRRSFVAPELQAIRQENLRTLTEGKGAKRVLADLLNLSPANISHRLNGLKHLDNDEIARIAAAVEIDVSWFDTPQTSQTIPSQALAILSPSESGSSIRATPVEAPKKVVRGATQVLSPEVLASSALAGTLIPNTEPKEVVDIQLSKAGAPAPETLIEEESPDVSSTTPAEEVSPPVSPQATPPTVAPVVASSNLADLSEFTTLEQSAPVAASLLRVLKLKISQGRIDELRAASLLAELANL